MPTSSPTDILPMTAQSEQDLQPTAAHPLDVAVVIPTLNEAANVARLVERLTQVLHGRAWEVIFVEIGRAHV